MQKCEKSLHLMAFYHTNYYALQLHLVCTYKYKKHCKWWSSSIKVGWWLYFSDYFWRWDYLFYFIWIDGKCINRLLFLHFSREFIKIYEHLKNVNYEIWLYVLQEQVLLGVSVPFSFIWIFLKVRLSFSFIWIDATNIYLLLFMHFSQGIY